MKTRFTAIILTLIVATCAMASPAMASPLPANSQAEPVGFVLSAIQYMIGWLFEKDAPPPPVGYPIGQGGGGMNDSTGCIDPNGGRCSG